MKNLLKNLIIVILFCGILFFGRSIFVYHFFNANVVVLPKLVGLQKEEAIKILDELQLKHTLLNGMSTVAPKNVVLTQYPEANSKVKENRNIQLLINSDNPTLVPNIEGMTLIEAKRELRSKKINIDRIDYYPYEGDKDVILSTYPNIGKPLRHNQGISLLVSSSTISLGNVMPNIIGLTLEQAIFLLSNTGIKVREISYSEDNTKENNTILSTNPMPGEKVQDNFINIVINKISRENIVENEIDQIIRDSLDELKKGKNEVSSNQEN